MKSRWKKYLAAGLLTAGVLSLTGCHGAKEEKNFELPVPVCLFDCNNFLPLYSFLSLFVGADR